MRILVATDAWRPQVNGVVNTYERISEEAPKLGVTLDFIEPSAFLSLPCPSYPQIPLSLVTKRAIGARIRTSEPTFIHIATEGPIGLATRAYCLSNGRKFTTSYHTRFPEYVAARWPIPIEWLYSYERWFHNAGCGMLVVTASLSAELLGKGFRRVLPWSRGVDTQLFKPTPVRNFGNDTVYLYVGRIAPEKNIDAFLQLQLAGRKVVIGDGPLRQTYQRRYSEVLFCGSLQGQQLCEAYSSADALVFPSLTDTFGNVMLEALACGTPVAAYPVTGPKDLLTSDLVGILDYDLAKAAQRATTLQRSTCREHALRYTWNQSAQLFIASITQANTGSQNDVPLFKEASIDRHERESFDAKHLR